MNSFSFQAYLLQNLIQIAIEKVDKSLILFRNNR